MNEQEIKARAYRILYERYKGLFEQLARHARNIREHGDDSRKIKTLSEIGDLEKYVHIGFLDKGDWELIKTLEYLLGERDKID